MADEEEVSLGLVLKFSEVGSEVAQGALDTIGALNDALSGLNGTMGPGVDQAASEGGAAMDAANSIFETVTDTIGEMSGQLGNLITNFLSSPTKIAAVGSAFVLAGETTVHWAKGISSLMAVTGLSMEQAELYGTALSNLGKDSDSLVRATTILTRQLGAATAELRNGGDGANRATRALAELGIGFHDAENNMLPMGDLLPNILDKLSTLGDKAREQYAQEIFGRQFREVMPLLKNYETSLNEAAEQLGMFGIHENNASEIKKRYAQDMTTLTLIFEKATHAVFPAFIAVLDGIVNVFSRVAVATQRFFGWLKEHETTLKNLALAVLAVVGPVILLNAAYATFAAISAGVAAVAAVIASPMFAIGAAIAVIAAALIGAAYLIITHFDQIKAAAVRVWEYMAGYLAPIFERIGAVIRTVIEWVRQHQAVVLGLIAVALTPLLIILGTVYASFMIMVNVLKLVWAAFQIGYDVARDVFTTVADYAARFINWLGDQWGKLRDILSTPFHAVATVVGNVMSGLINMILSMLGVIGNALAAFGKLPIFGSIFDGVSKTLNAVRDGAKGIIDSVVSTAKSATDTVTGFVGGVKSAFSLPGGGGDRNRELPDISGALGIDVDALKKKGGGGGGSGGFGAIAQDARDMADAINYTDPILQSFARRTFPVFREVVGDAAATLKSYTEVEQAYDKAIKEAKLGALDTKTAIQTLTASGQGLTEKYRDLQTEFMRLWNSGDRGSDALKAVKAQMDAMRQAGEDVNPQLRELEARLKGYKDAETLLMSQRENALAGVTDRVKELRDAAEEFRKQQEQARRDFAPYLARSIASAGSGGAYIQGTTANGGTFGAIIRAGETLSMSGGEKITSINGQPVGSSDGGGSGAPPAGMPQAATGGWVDKTGYAVIHQGEFVTRADRSNVGASEVTINVNVSGLVTDEAVQQVSRALRDSVMASIRYVHQ